VDARGGDCIIVGSVDTPGEAYRVAVAGTHAYVADWGSGLQVVDISNPTSPAIVGSVGTPGGARGVAVADNHAYVADGGSGLQVVDISNPASPAIVGSVDTPGGGHGVAVAGTHAYVADRSGSGLQVVDISNPASPAIVGSVDTPGDAWGVGVAGNYAYVADYDGGLQVVDISNPASPAIVGSVGTPDYAFGVAVADNHAYVADRLSGLQVADISNPASPAIVGSVDTPGVALGVTVAGTHAYVADYESGLQIVNISNPALPVIVGSVDTPGEAYGVAVAGIHVYVADSGAGLQVILAQCAEPTSVEISSFEATPVPGAILLSWSTSFEFDHVGFHVHRSTVAEGAYELVTPEVIEPPGPYRFLDSDVSVGTTYFYRLEAMDRTDGRAFFGPVVVRMEAPSAIGLRDWLGQSHPNPFRGESERTAIRFELAGRTRATLEVFDASGRLVRLVLDETLEAGEHAGFWDGRNARGEAVGSGIYFYRLEAGEFSETRSLVRLK
jgi:hypothetical protein